MSLGKVALGVASLMIGVSHIKNAGKHFSEAGGKPRGPGLGRVDKAKPFLDSGRHTTPNGPMRMRSYNIETLEDRIKHLRKLVDEGKRDPRVYSFAREAINKRCGDDWCIPEKANEQEAKAIFDVTRRKVRYTSDIHSVDTYQKPGHTLSLGSADCLPEGTLLLRSDGSLAPIEDIVVGEEVFDGVGWARVTNWWDKDRQPTLDFELNNGCRLTCTEGHRLFRVKNGKPEEVLAGDLRVGDDLWQPRELAFESAKTLPRDDAFLMGAYLAEGSVKYKRVDGKLATVSIAGVPDGKFIREEIIEIAGRLNLRVTEQKREVYLSCSDDYLENLLGDIARGAFNKKMSNVNWSPETVKHILEGLNADGGFSTSGTNFVFSTTSPTLAVQYRLLQRVFGKSCSIKRVDEHGGFGSHPIYRVTVRESNVRRQWARVKSISEGTEQHVFDIETDSHRFYLPESDVITHNCDDYSSLLCSLLLSVGIPCRFKVIRTRDAKDWNHIYAQAGFPRAQPTKWVSLDASVPVPFGWEAPARMVAASKVFPVR